MRILHYALGFSPYRTGGLTKFCIDLMINQQNHGDDVALLWPGRIKLISNKVKIVESEDSITGIKSYEIINPNPVSLDEGIQDINSYMKQTDIEFYKKWFENKKPDVLHIHTLMGLHKELIMAAKECGIRTVFTSHDYFGLCPKVTLFHDGAVCDNDNECNQCVKCNETALSLKKVMVMQSEFYRFSKNTKIVKLLRDRHRRAFFEDEQSNNINNEKGSTNRVLAEGYKKLRIYYINILKMIDIIHFNSSVTKKIYERFFVPQNSCIVNISNSSIKSHKIIKKFNDGKLRIIYLSPAKPFKGYKILKEALDELWEDGYRDFSLDIFSATNNVSPYMNIHDEFEHSQLRAIFEKSDLLIAPSVWYETFGFTVLEALSYGVPVIVSDNVGAKDVIGDGGYIIESNAESIKQAVKKILMDRSILTNMNEAILKLDIMTEEDMSEKIYKIYKGKNK